MILKILRTKISSEILVVRRYKNSDKSTHSITNVPILFNDNIYEPSYAKISMVNIIILKYTFFKHFIHNQTFHLNSS